MPCSRYVRRHKWSRWWWVDGSGGAFEKRTCRKCGTEERRKAKG